MALDFKKGLAQLKELLPSDALDEFNVLQPRLLEIIDHEELYGVSNNEKWRVIRQLNRLAKKHLAVNFNDLCVPEDKTPEADPKKDSIDPELREKSGTKSTELAQEVEDVPPPQPKQPYPNPTLRPEPPPTPFIDRKVELEDLSEKLSACRDEGGIYILVGQAGVGKTALAAQLANVLATSFEHSILWIPLEKAHKTDSLLRDIAEACGFSPSDYPNINSCLYQALCTYRPLLIINYTENTPKITTALLDKCKGIATVLVLSNTRKVIEKFKKVRGVFEVNPLPRDEAIKFAKERLRSEGYMFKTDEYTISTLCEQLGDLPLALEMAAGYISTRKMTPKEYINHHLEEPLSKESKLKGCFQLSYKHLTKNARLALIVLAYDGEASTALEAVAAGMGRRWSCGDAERACFELIQYNLIDRKDLKGQLRYVLPPIMRRYAKKQFLTAPKEFDGQLRHILNPIFRYWAEKQLCAMHNKIRTRLTKHYLTYVKNHAQDYNALETEHANLLAAMKYAYDTKKWRIVQRFALRLCDTAEGYLRTRGHWQELHDRLEQAIYATKSRVFVQPRTRQNYIAKFTSDLAAVHYLRGDPSAARQEYEKSLAIYETWEAQENIAAITLRLGKIATDAGEYDSARQFYERSLEIFQSYDSQSNSAMTLYYLGHLVRKQNKDNEALRYFEQSLSMYREINNVKGIADVLHEMGIIALEHGDANQRTREYYEKSLTIAEQSKMQEDIAFTSYELGRLEHIRGNYTAAQSYYKTSFNTAKRLGMGQFSTIQHAYIILMKKLISLVNSGQTKDKAETLQLYQQILDISQDLGDTEIENTAKRQLVSLREE